MGFFSDIFDMGMKAAYVVSAGFVGKSDDVYHFGPLHVSDTSCSIVYKTGLLNLEVKLSRSDCGSWQPAVGIGLGIPGRAEIRVEAQKTTEGFTIAQSLSVNAGPVKIDGGFTIDQDFNVTKREVTGIAGPLYAKFKNTNDNERFVEAGIQARGLKTKTKIDLKHDVDFEKICKNTKVDIDYEYLKNKVAEEFFGEESKEDEDEKEEKKNKQAERKNTKNERAIFLADGQLKNNKEVNDAVIKENLNVNREENKPDKKTNVNTRQKKELVKADKFYCDICKSFNCELNK